MPIINDPLEIIHFAQSKGISLFVDKGRLGINKGDNENLSPDFMKLIKENKNELIGFLEKGIEASTSTTFLDIKKVKEAESYVISNAQYRLWLVSQTEEGSIAYNIPSILHFNEELNIECFNKAIEAVIERHEILRTVFKIEKTGEVRQYIKDSEELKTTLELKDLRGEKDPETYRNALISSNNNEPFDLENGPLIKMSLFQVSDKHFVFYYNIHHIISDAWSKDVLSKDIVKFYNAYLNNIKLDISPLNIQYKDYASWQHEKLNNNEFEKSKEYWLSQFKEKTSLINLPSSKQRQKVKTYNGRELGLQLAPDIMPKVNLFVKENGGSTFMFFLTVLKILIYRYTGETDITLGNPAAGRNHPNLENQIGFYVNVLPLRNKINIKSNFVEVYEQIKQNTLNAYKHQMYPFGKLLEDLNLNRDVSRSPLFDIDIDYHITSSKTLEEDYNKGVLDKGKTMAKYDIEFDPVESENGMYLSVRYNTDVYEYEMMERFVMHYENLVSAFLDNPSIAISTVNYFTVEEQTILLKGERKSTISVPNDKTIIDYFLDRVEETPDFLAVVHGREKLTYKEIDDRSNALAHYLISKKEVEKGDFVGIYMDMEVDYITAILGILKAGGTYISIDRKYPHNRKKYIVENSSLKTIITTTSHMFEIDFYEESIMAIDVELELNEKQTSKINLSDSKDLVYVLYTSGTTGNPKGVMISHYNLLDYLCGLTNSLKLNAERYSYGLLSTPSADLGNTVLFGALITGGILHTFSKDMTMNIFDLHKYFEKNNIDIIKIVPSHWNSLCSGEITLLPKKSIIFGGEKLNNSIIERVKKENSKISVFNHYGPTETTIGKLIYEVDLNRKYKNIPIGKPFSNTSVYILDDTLNLVPFGAVGELYIDGLGLAKGYYDNEKLTSEAFISHPFKQGEKIYKTGDLAKFSLNRNVQFLGRIDSQIKIRGHRVETLEIEYILNTIEYIKQSVVIPKIDNAGITQLIAYVVSEETLDTVNIISILKLNLPEYMIPRIFKKIENIPLTSNGKIDHKLLPEIENEENDLKKKYLAPDTFEEEILIKAWESVLKIEKIGIEDDFYKLGGDSITSIQMLIFLKNKGFDLQVIDIIENPVLKDMAKSIIKNYDKEYRDPNSFKTIPIELTTNKSVEVSENQLYFINRPWAVIVSNTISLTNFSTTTFKNELLTLLNLYPSLLVTFKKKVDDNEVLQEISDEEIKLKIKITDYSEFTNYEEIEIKSHDFLQKQFNYFDDSSLLRFFVVIDPEDKTKAFLRFSIAHALVDIDTIAQITNNLEYNFKAPKKVGESFSNLDFAIWQKKFLKSDKGAAKRNWWIKYLNSFSLKVTKMLFDNEPILYKEQCISIKGVQFQNIKERINTLNLPIVSLFLASHQYLLNELGYENCLQKIAVSGRGNHYDNTSEAEVLGVTTNYLPLKIVASSNILFKEYVNAVYEQYLKVRLHYEIPYMIIKKDYIRDTNNDIDHLVNGYFNFRIKENKRLNEDTQNLIVRDRKLRPKDVFELSLICDLYENGLEIKLLCPQHIYENKKYKLNLKSFIKNKLLLNSHSLSEDKVN